MMQDELCPTCHNPLGASLKAMREERDRIIAFVLQQTPKREEHLRREEEINQREEHLQQNEAALAELIKEARIPEVTEFENLKYENLALKKQVGFLIESQNDAIAMLRSTIDSLQQDLESEKNRKREWEEKSAALSAKNAKLVMLTEALREKIKRLEDQYQNAKEQELAAVNNNNLLALQNQDLSKKIISTENKTLRLLAEKKQLQAEYQKLIDDDSNSAFVIKDLDLVHALSSHVVEQFAPPTKVVTLGDGPYDEYEFDDYLRHLSIEPYTGDCAWIILGREGWSEEQIDELIENSDLDEVRVFSQELFVAGILTTHDPFSLPIEMLKKFAEGHPALEYLMESGFEWPEINFEEDYGDPSFHMGFAGGVDESPLTAIGYHVGVTRGLDEKDRRKLLEMAFKQKIPAVGDEAYMKEWGRPNHSKRLWRIAHHIKREAEKRKTIDSMRHACRHWKSDSEWLKNQFYTNRMRFQWPDV